MHQIRQIGIVGTGVMGAGIAKVMALAGYAVNLVKWRDGDVEAARGKFEQAVMKDVERGKLTSEEATQMLRRLVWSDRRRNDLDRCDLVIEAIKEDEEEKLACFAEICPRLKQAAILASTTSSLSIATLAKATDRPQLFLGLHFFNPPTVMRLVEVVTLPGSDAACILWMRSLLKELGKEGVEVRDAPGFVVNRLLVGQFLEAIRMAFDDAPVADIVGIDACMRFGANHKLGPFELMDFIGLDVVLAMVENLHEDLRQLHFSTPDILENLVAVEMLGRKKGLGFYDYSDKEHLRPNPELARLSSAR